MYRQLYSFYYAPSNMNTDYSSTESLDESDMASKVAHVATALAPYFALIMPLIGPVQAA